MLGSKMRIAQVSRSLTKLLDIRSLKLMDDFAEFSPSPLSMKQMVEFGRTATEEESFHFLRREIPVRLSNIMKEVNLLPSALLQMPSALRLQGWYAESFRELCRFDAKDGNRETLDTFYLTLASIMERHKDAVQMMAQSVLELKDSHTVDMQTELSIQYFLDRFYMSRISTRMLMNQHMALFEPGSEPDLTRVGTIDPSCKVAGVIEAAYGQASVLCNEYYSCVPDLDITVHNHAKPGEPVEIVYPPSHLRHILFELFKNSMRAVVESRKSATLPDVEVLVVKGQHDLTIKVSDQGGGIPRQVTDHLFQYLFSTAPRPSMTPTKAPLAGYGYGLPLSRLYARYFHGDLILNSYEGYGTDTVVFLKSRTEEANELLPIFNKTSSNQYKAAVQTADWTDFFATMNNSYQVLQQHGGKKKEAAVAAEESGGSQ